MALRQSCPLSALNPDRKLATTSSFERPRLQIRRPGVRMTSFGVVSGPPITPMAIGGLRANLSNPKLKTRPGRFDSCIAWAVGKLVAVWFDDTFKGAIIAVRGHYV